MTKRTKNKLRPKTITLKVSPSERVIISQLFQWDEELEKHLNSNKTSDSLSLTLEEWEIMAEGLAAEVDNTTNKKRQKLLEGLLTKIEGLLVQHDPVESADNEVKEIDLTDFAPAGPAIEAEALEYMEHFIADIEKVCSATGINVEKLLESFTPIKIGPQDRIGVHFNGKQRALLRELPETPKAIKSIIRDTPPRKQKLALTLSQVHELENIVARLIPESSDAKLKRALQRIDGELINVQVHYTDGNDAPPSGLKWITQPNSLSRGALVRQLITQMLQSRLPQKNGKKK